jgi:type II restriction/modification system DNA methylase subunit YeeA
LYNLKEDRYEHINLHDLKPEILQELEEKFDEWNKANKPPLWPRIMDYKIIINGKEYLFPA